MIRYGLCIGILVMLFSLGFSSCHAAPVDTVDGGLAIIPLPARMTSGEGSYIIEEDLTVLVHEFAQDGFDPVTVFAQVFEKKSGYPLRTITMHQAGKLRHEMVIARTDAFTNPEQYTLTVSSRGINIEAAHAQGVFYALQTLRQIMRMDAQPDALGTKRTWRIPAVTIADQPGFGYRGMHLDVVRHFMPLDFIRKYIDVLAYYKMNRFHWHLTDDQGWRIEIKRYPRLQEVSAWRDQTLVGHYREEPDVYDGLRHGGYYTQEQVKEIVAYAAQRGIMVIPEIEMPGHAVAALAAYPELACFPDTFEVEQTWGVFDDVFCPKEETFTFLQNVLAEVMPLFPSPYVHIGGDECPKKRWKACPHCQALIAKERLIDEHGLQSYFVQRMEKFVNANGKKIIGWDEILEGGLAPNATVMSWRGTKGGIASAQSGHDVIMSPGTHCYFDHPQADPATEPVAMSGLTPLDKVYGFNPVPEILTPEQAKHILGAQANLWTEYIGTPEHAMYMAYPRAFALAETLWTPADRKDYGAFLVRLGHHRELLDAMGIVYARHFENLLPPEVKE